MIFIDRWIFLLYLKIRKMPSYWEIITIWRSGTIRHSVGLGLYSKLTHILLRLRIRWLVSWMICSGSSSMSTLRVFIWHNWGISWTFNLISLWIIIFPLVHRKKISLSLIPLLLLHLGWCREIVIHFKAVLLKCILIYLFNCLF
jgi:hypothetical protein